MKEKGRNDKGMFSEQDMQKQRRAKLITAEQLLNNSEFQAIDVRSPGEFDESHIPGAVNIPIFSNEERAEIGTIYKQIGERAARWKAMEVVSAKIPAIMSAIKSISDSGSQPVIHCWRGGMRSKSIAQFAELSGLSVYRLEGGYRAYRQYILEEMTDLVPEQSVVLHGMTGVGKTEILWKLAEEDYPVIDLEGAANHKGSLFGSFGLGKPHNQKTFDSILYQQLCKIENSSYYIMEAESKRVGHAVVPDSILQGKAEGIHIVIESSIKARVERTYKEYVEDLIDQEWFMEKTEENLIKITKRLRNPELEFQLWEDFRTRNFRGLIEKLYIYYYDPRYQFKEDSYKGDHHYIIGDDIDDICNQIKAILKEYGLTNTNQVSKGRSLS